MKEIEEILQEEKLNSALIPSNLEERLTNKLMNHQKPKKKKYPWIASFAVAAVFLLLLRVNMNGIAYYSKLLIGYEALLPEYNVETIKNENGQLIDQSLVIDENMALVVDKIVTDANKTFVFIKIKGNETTTEELAMNWISFATLEGWNFNHRVTSTVSQWIEEERALYSVLTFDSVNGFTKKLHLTVTNPFFSSPKSVTLSFNYQADQALPTIYKKSLNEKLQLKDGYIKLKTISGSSMSTYLEGTLQLPENIRLGTQRIDLSDIQLIVNGKILEQLASGIQSRFNQLTFTIETEGLPEKIEDFVLAIPTFINYKQVDLTFPTDDLQTKEGITIHSVVQENNKTFVTLTTSKDVLLDNVSVQLNNKKTVPLEKTINTIENANEKTRTLVFPTTETIKSLHVQGIYYKETYNFEIKIK